MSLPHTLTIKEEITEDTPHSSSFVFRYLPPTAGLTVGNYLRRTILTSVKGVAPIGVEISDKNGPAKSKFTALVGVVETTPYLILNCKKIVLEIKEEKDEIVCLEMDIENSEDKEYTVTANDFRKNSG